MDYVKDYTLEERLGTAGRQQMPQNKKVVQDYSSLSNNNGETRKKMDGLMDDVYIEFPTYSNLNVYNVQCVNCSKSNER